MPKRIRVCLIGVAGCIALAALCGMLAVPDDALADHRGSPHGGGGGNGGNVGGDVAGDVFSKLTFDNLATGGIRSDDGTYEHGTQNTHIVIGRSLNMHFDFHDRENKPEIRTILFFPEFDNDGILLLDEGGFPATEPGSDLASLELIGCEPLFNNMDVIAPADLTVNPTGLVFAGSAELKITGEDFDDLPVGCMQFGNASLRFFDGNGQGWTVSFGNNSQGGGTPAPCGSLIEVLRLPNLDGDNDGNPDNPGISQWMFSTMAPHHGYLYRDRDKPNSDIEFYGIVTLPFGGTVESLTEETTINCP